MKILVVDDSAPTRKVITQELEPFGYEVEDEANFRLIGAQYDAEDANSEAVWSIRVREAN